MIKEHQSSSFIEFESYVDRQKSPGNASVLKIEDSSNKLKEVNESSEVIQRRISNFAEGKNRDSPNFKSANVGGLMNGSPSKYSTRNQNNEVKSVHGLSAAEIKEESKSESLKEISLSNVNVNVADQRGSAQPYENKIKKVIKVL